MIIRPRLAFEANYTQIPNAWMRDGRLSLRARGLLAQLMSHSPGWRVTVDSLIAENKEGRDAIRAALAELRDAGYLTVAARRSEDNQRLNGQDYLIADPLETDPSVAAALLKTSTTENQHYGESTHKEDHLQEDQEEQKRAPRRKPPATALPKDWTPTPEHVERAKKRGVDITHEAEQFRLHADATDRRIPRWNSAFTMWLNNSKPSTTPPPKPKREWQPSAKPKGWTE